MKLERHTKSKQIDLPEPPQHSWHPVLVGHMPQAIWKNSRWLLIHSDFHDLIVSKVPSRRPLFFPRRPLFFPQRIFLMLLSASELLLSLKNTEGTFHTITVLRTDNLSIKNFVSLALRSCSPRNDQL
jgi:hypothetical protein